MHRLCGGLGGGLSWLLSSLGGRCGGLAVEKGLVLLLGLDESFLEEMGVCICVSSVREKGG